MKIIIGAIILVVVMAGVLQYSSETVSYVKSESTVEVVQQTQEVKKVDAIEKARQELERINKELDAKEQELLQERDALDAELERLRETRMSFQ